MDAPLHDLLKVLTSGSSAERLGSAQRIAERAMMFGGHYGVVMREAARGPPSVSIALMEALGALGVRGDREAIWIKISAMLKARSRLVRLAAAMALWRLVGDPRAALRETGHLLRSKQQARTCAAVAAAAELGSCGTSLKAPLRELGHRARVGDLPMIAWALWRVGAGTRVPAAYMGRVLQEGRPRCQVEALLLLGGMPTVAQHLIGSISEIAGSARGGAQEVHVLGRRLQALLQSDPSFRQARMK